MQNFRILGQLLKLPPLSGQIWNSFFLEDFNIFELGRHAKFQNPRTTLLGKNYLTWKRRKIILNKYSHLQCQRAAQPLCLDQFSHTHNTKPAPTDMRIVGGKGGMPLELIRTVWSKFFFIQSIIHIRSSDSKGFVFWLQNSECTLST
jgi:hypothetical protein